MANTILTAAKFESERKALYGLWVQGLINYDEARPLEKIMVIDDPTVGQTLYSRFGIHGNIEHLTIKERESIKGAIIYPNEIAQPAECNETGGPTPWEIDWKHKKYELFDLTASFTWDDDERLIQFIKGDE